MPVTERLILPVQGGQEQWKDGLKSMLQTLKTQEGYIRTRWGPHSENENNLELLIGWDSQEAQKKFQNGPEFGPAMEAFRPHLRTGEKPTVYFVQFTPYAPKQIIDAAIVQTITITGSSASEDTIRAALNKYSGLEGCTGVAAGPALSEVDGKKVFVGIMGWESLEASSKNGHAVKVDVDGSLEEHHVNFRYPIKGFRGL